MFPAGDRENPQALETDANLMKHSSSVWAVGLDVFCDHPCKHLGSNCCVMGLMYCHVPAEEPAVSADKFAGYLREADRKVGLRTLNAQRHWPICHRLDQAL